MQICNFSEGFATHILPGLCLQVFVTDQLKILVLQNVLFSINLEKLGWSLRVYEKKIKIFQDFTILSYFLKIGNSKKNPFLIFLGPFLKKLKFTRTVCTIWMQLLFFENAYFERQVIILAWSAQPTLVSKLPM